jgi:CoA:oxalate CoA-transferase
MPPSGPLSDLVVVDLTRVLAGPYCTQLLRDLGARVIKVERPGGGDDARAIGPFVGEDSAYFTSVNRGKQSIALDLKADADREVFEALLQHADVLVENYRPGTLARLGYGFDALHARYPLLVLASTSGFGQTGPLATRPAYDLIAQAMGGLMSLTGEPGGAPTRVGTSIGDLAAGLFTAIGVLSALHDRARSGEGRHVDVAMLDCQVALLENAIARYETTGEVPGPIGSRHPSITPFRAFATADHPIVIAAGNDALFEKLCACIGRPELRDDARFGTNAARTEHEPELRAEIEAVLETGPAESWLARLEAAEIPCGPIQDVAQVLAHPQVNARGMVAEATTPGGARLRVAGSPVRISGFESRSGGAAPALDADRASILEELARRRAEGGR